MTPKERLLAALEQRPVDRPLGPPRRERERGEREERRDARPHRGFRERHIRRVEDQHPRGAEEAVYPHEHHGGPQLAHAHDGDRREPEQRQDQDRDQLGLGCPYSRNRSSSVCAS